MSACSEWNNTLFIDKVNSIPNVYHSVSSKEILIKNDLVYQDGKLYNGFLFELDSISKDTILVATYLNGKTEGISKKYYSKNHLMEIRDYSNGEKNGSQIAYWENGKKRFEYTAKKDIYEGEMKEWNTDGSLYHLAHFKNGQEDGEQKFWYDNGKIKANYVILNGKRYGLLGTKNCKNVSDSIFVVQ